MPGARGDYFTTRYNPFSHACADLLVTYRPDFSCVRGEYPIRDQLRRQCDYSGCGGTIEPKAR